MEGESGRESGMGTFGMTQKKATGLDRIGSE